MMDSIPAVVRIAIGITIAIAALWLKPAAKIEKIIKRLTIVLREVNSLPIDASAPMIINATVARPNSGAKKTLSYALIKLKNGAKAVATLLAYWPMLSVKISDEMTDGLKTQLSTSGVIVPRNTSTLIAS